MEQQGHQVAFRDLCLEGFDPLITREEIPDDGPITEAVQEHCADLTTADGIIIVHPNWWGQPPAILKGWIDRVIRPGVAYRFDEGDDGEGVPIGLLKAKSAVVFNTANTPEERENHVFGDPLERIWRDCIFDLCGVKDVHRRIFRVIVTSTLEQRQAWLTEAVDLCRSVFSHSS